MKVVMLTVRVSVSGTFNSHHKCTVEIYDDAGVLVATGSNDQWPKPPSMALAAAAALAVIDRLRADAATQLDQVLNTTFTESAP